MSSDRSVGVEVGHVHAVRSCLLAWTTYSSDSITQGVCVWGGGGGGGWGGGGGGGVGGLGGGGGGGGGWGGGGGGGAGGGGGVEGVSE